MLRIKLLFLRPERPVNRGLKSNLNEKNNTVNFLSSGYKRRSPVTNSVHYLLIKWYKQTCMGLLEVDISMDKYIG